MRFLYTLVLTQRTNARTNNPIYTVKKLVDRLLAFIVTYDNDQLRSQQIEE